MAVRLLDYILRRATGVFEFCEDPACLLRIRIAEAPHALSLGGQLVLPGQRVVELHLWNDHVLPIPRQGATLSWAVQTRRMFVSSLEQLARYVENRPDLADIAAIGGASAVLTPEYTGSAASMERLGFEIVPYRRPLGRFGEFWENLYAWWLMWTFNPASLRRRKLLDTRRREMWMTANAFLDRYGTRAGAR